MLHTHTRETNQYIDYTHIIRLQQYIRCVDGHYTAPGGRACRPIPVYYCCALEHNQRAPKKMGWNRGGKTEELNITYHTPQHARLQNKHRERGHPATRDRDKREPRALLSGCQVSGGTGGKTGEQRRIDRAAIMLLRKSLATAVAAAVHPRMFRYEQQNTKNFESSAGAWVLSTVGTHASTRSRHSHLGNKCC